MKSVVEIQMESLRPPIREAMRRNPNLIHRAFSLEAKISMAEIQGRQDELHGFMDQYSRLSEMVKRGDGPTGETVTV